MAQRAKGTKSWRLLSVAMLVLLLGVGVTASAAFASLPTQGDRSSQSQSKERKDSGKPITASQTGVKSERVPISAPANPNVVLYDQYNNFGNDGIVSTNDPGNPTFSAEAADDFMVTSASGWVIQSVDFQGSPGIPLAGPVTVRFYTNAGNLPGTVVYTSAGLAATGTDPNWSVTLNNPPTLAQGTYWVSVQPTQACCWYWAMRSAGSIAGNQAAWREAGGFGTGCTNWGNRDTCTGTALGDQMFRLNGELGSPTPTGTPPTATRTPTATNTPCPAGGYTTAVTTGATIVPGTTNTGNHCDDCVTGITLPFPYTLYDQTFTTANVSSNGNLQFTGANGAFSNVCLPASGFSYTIHGHWDDLYTTDAGAGQGIFTSVSGTAPNRIFNIEWRAQFCCSGGPPVVNFEIRLYEGQSRFDVIYGQVQGDGGGATSGVQKDATTHTQYSCNTPTLTTGTMVTYTHQGGGCPTPSATPTCNPTGSYSVLIVYADTTPPTTLRNELLAEAGISQVDLFDAQTNTPTLAQLQPYDIVVTFSNEAYANSTTLGNNLADYQDGGGIVVVGAFGFRDHPSLGIYGRWRTDGYAPYTYTLGQYSTSVTLGTYNAGHPLMQNVTTLNAGVRHNSNVAAGATGVAAYSDGSQAVAYKGRAVGFTVYPGNGILRGTGQYARVIANAGRWLSPRNPCITGTLTPTVTRTSTATLTRTSTSTATRTATPPCPPGGGSGILIGSSVTIGYGPNNYTTLASNIVNHSWNNGLVSAPNQYAIFQTHDPWGGTVIKDRITAAGRTYAVFTPAQLAGFNFSQYRVVILNWDDHYTTDFITPYTNVIPALQSYIASGGAVWVQASIQGTSGDSFPMPYGGTGNWDLHGTNNIVQPAHPMVAGVPNPITGSFASHAEYTSLPAGANVVVVTGSSLGAGGNSAGKSSARGGTGSGTGPNTPDLPTLYEYRPAGGGGSGVLIGSSVTIGYGPNNYQTLATNIVNHSWNNGLVSAPNQYAIFQTHDPWGAQVIEDRITAAGRTYTEFTPAQLAGFNFSQYRVIVLNWDDHFTSDFITPYTNALPALQSYIASGGAVWVQASIQGSGGDSFPMPYGGTGNWDLHAENNIVQPAHPMVAGVPNPITGSFASHAEYTSLPAGANVVVVTGASLRPGAGAPGGNSARGASRSTGAKDTPSLPTLYEYRPAGGGCPSPSATATRTSTVTATRTSTVAPSATATCPAGGGGYRVLIAHADCNVPPNTLRNQILAEGASVVDIFDAGAGTPTLGQMLTYDVVVVFNDCSYQDPVTLGNNLADYQDAGGVPVVFTFAWGSPSLEGRWMTGGYTPFNYPGGGAHFANHTLGTYNAAHPLMQGITAGSLTAFYVNLLTPSAGASVEALWNDGHNLVAHKTVGGRTGIGVNAYVGDNANQWAGPYGRIVMNAARWLRPGAGGCPTPSATATATPTPGCTLGQNYTYSVSAGATIVPGTTYVPGSTCDSCTVLVNLPFSYSFYGTPYSQVRVSNKGVVQFISNSSDGNNTCLPSATFNDAIFVYWDEHNTNINDTMGMFTSVSGTAPNRIFNIEWRSGYVANDVRSRFQVRLYEGQPKFDTIYATTRRGFSATVGVQKGTGERFTQYACNVNNSVPNGTKITWDQRVCPGMGAPQPQAPRPSDPGKRNTP